MLRTSMLRKSGSRASSCLPTLSPFVDSDATGCPSSGLESQLSTRPTLWYPWYRNCTLSFSMDQTWDTLVLRALDEVFGTDDRGGKDYSYPHHRHSRLRTGRPAGMVAAINPYSFGCLAFGQRFAATAWVGFLHRFLHFPERTTVDPAEIETTYPTRAAVADIRIHQRLVRMVLECRPVRCAFNGSCSLSIMKTVET